jgi:hypothetical protein
LVEGDAGIIDQCLVLRCYDPGEAYQFDRSHEAVPIGVVTTTVKVAYVRLCHSRMPFVGAYPRETQEMMFDPQDKGCARGIYDSGNCPPLVRRQWRMLMLN